MKLKGSLALLLVLLIELTTACTGEDTRWAYKYNGMEVPAGVYIENMLRSVSDVEMQYTEMHIEDENFEYPTLKSLLKENIGGKSASDLIVNGARERTKEFIFVEEKFKEKGLEIPELQVAALTEQLKSNWETQLDPNGSNPYYTFATLNEKNGISFDSSLLIQLNMLKREMLLLDMYKNGEKAIGEEALKKEFADYYAKAEAMIITKSYEESADSSAEDAKLKMLAEEYLEKAKNGENISKLMHDYWIYKSTENGEDASDIAQPAKEQYTVILSRDNISGENSFESKLFAASTGEIGLYEDERGFYIYKKLNILEDPQDLENYKDDYIFITREEEFDSYVKAEAEKLDVTENSKAISRYTPANIKEK